MPEFIPEHTPPGLDDFTKGFFTAAEWLLDEEVDRSKLRGFTKAAIKRGKADCRKFLKLAGPDGFEGYPRDMNGAGVDFWLTRNGQGAGFWSRCPKVPCLEPLTKLSETFGELNADVYRGWINFI